MHADKENMMKLIYFSRQHWQVLTPSSMILREEAIQVSHLVIRKLTYTVTIRTGFFFLIARNNFLKFYYILLCFHFLTLIVNAGIFYVSNHWAGTRKKLSGKVFILSTMKTRYYCLIWPFINMGYSILHNRFLVHASITDLYCVEN